MDQTTFKEFKESLGRPAYQVIKGVHVKDSTGEFCDILDDPQGVTYDTVPVELTRSLDKHEVLKVDVFGSECFHVYVDFTVNYVRRYSAVEVDFGNEIRMSYESARG